MMKGGPAARMLLALLAGAAMPLAFSPYDHGWLAAPLLACWLWLARAGRPLRVGFAFGFGWFGIGAWWLAPTFHHYGHLPWPLAALCVALVGLALAWLPALWSWVALRVGGRSAGLLLAFPAAAVCEEWLRGHVFTGLPWTALGNTMLDAPGVGWGAWFGAYGLAALPALVAAGLALTFERRHRRAGLAAAALGAGLMLAGPSIPEPQGPARTASLVQPDIPQDVKWDAAFLNETMRRLAALSDGARGEVVIWPEAAAPFFIDDAPGWRDWLTANVRRWRRPLLFGGLRRLPDGGGENGLFAWTAAGRAGFAGKRHLVPFGEYVPSWLPFLHTLVPEIAQFRPADSAAPLQAAGERFGALICYESIFPEEARARVLAGARVLVNVTNDAWYGRSPAAWQHFQAARMRAVETGRYVLRAANTGVTALIAPDGRVLASLPWWTQGRLEVTYFPSDARTRYVQWGDAPLLAAPLALLALALARRGRRNEEVR